MPRAPSVSPTAASWSCLGSTTAGRSEGSADVRVAPHSNPGAEPAGGREEEMCVMCLEMRKIHFYKQSFLKNYTEHFSNITID